MKPDGNNVESGAKAPRKYNRTNPPRVGEWVDLSEELPIDWSQILLLSSAIFTVFLLGVLLFMNRKVSTDKKADTPTRQEKLDVKAPVPSVGGQVKAQLVSAEIIASNKIRGRMSIDAKGKVPQTATLEVKGDEGVRTVRPEVTSDGDGFQFEIAASTPLPTQIRLKSVSYANGQVVEVKGEWIEIGRPANIQKAFPGAALPIPPPTQT